MRISIKDLNKYLFDFIGDAHGCRVKLDNLLEKMGYVKDDEGIYYHPERKAFFLGDIVDGGPNVVDTFYMVKRMVEKGYAFAIMGNHEINLIAFNTKDNEGNLLRERSNEKLRQCKNSLDLILSKEAKENMKFLLSLPLFVDTDNFRTIHACWHQPSVDILKKYVDEENRLSNESMIALYKSEKGFDAMEKALKGIELTLPEEYAYRDKYGKKRLNCRYIWWREDISVESRLSHVPEDKIQLPDAKYQDDKVVFFGHYWMKGEPTIQSKKALCLDYSAMAGGYLCAYRFDNKELNKKHFVYV